MTINFNENDLKQLLMNISKQNKIIELMYKGWTDFQKDKLKYQVSNFEKKETMKK